MAVVAAVAAAAALAAALMSLLAAAALGAAKPSVSLKAAASTVKVGHVLHLTGTVHHAKAGAKSW